MHEMQTAMLTNLRTTYPKCGVVHIQDILNIQILQDFLKDGVDAVEKYEGVCQQSFLMLLEFLREQVKHETAIQKLLTTASFQTSGNKEMQIMAGLAHHLFSQLIPGKVYEVDKYAEQLQRECSCGCKAKICTGDTSVGSPGTWHGRVDVILNNTIAVAHGNKQNTIDEAEDDDTDIQEAVYDDTDEDEPQTKQRKVETDKSCDNCTEVKATEKRDSVQPDIKVLKQIFAEAITNGFAQVNRDKNALSHFLIPTFGVTSDNVSICLYDPESDYLLLIREQHELWWLDGRLDTVNLTIIWLFLNFTFFTRKKLSDVVELDKSGLHKDLKEHLKFYRKAQTKANYVSKTSVGLPWKLIAYPNCKKHRIASVASDS
ncbi:uncharacterized protein LOC117317956 [Pecten maximus]|uniref:uncharacterized protein LOC117317956 n=1 Tax=Pecten maximus TaxID=6579 RepID=UPI001458224D|nr:uncharacterized protein LOC117317956 [Pecten maximus]